MFDGLLEISASCHGELVSYLKVLEMTTERHGERERERAPPVLSAPPAFTDSADWASSHEDDLTGDIVRSE